MIKIVGVILSLGCQRLSFAASEGLETLADPSQQEAIIQTIKQVLHQEKVPDVVISSVTISADPVYAVDLDLDGKEELLTLCGVDYRGSDNYPTKIFVIAKLMGKEYIAVYEESYFGDQTIDSIKKDKHHPEVNTTLLRGDAYMYRTYQLQKGKWRLLHEKNAASETSVAP